MIDLTVSDAASLLRVSEKTIYRWIQKRTIPAYKIGGQYRFRRTDLLAWAGSRRIVVNAGSLIDPNPTDETAFTLHQALQAGGIYYRVGGATKNEVLRNAVGLLNLPECVNREYVLRELLTREDLSSTAVGAGIAVPHIRTPITPDLPHPLAALCLLEAPVDFHALDREPVAALVVVLSPSVRSHLRLMALLAFVLRDEAVLQAIHEQGGRSEIITSVAAAESRLATEQAEGELTALED